MNFAKATIELRTANSKLKKQEEQILEILSLKSQLENERNSLYNERNKLRDENFALSNRVSALESQLREEKNKRVVTSTDSRVGPDKTDKINVIHNVSLKVDNKLEKLHLLISDLTQSSRIMIDKENNIITDHPFVEGDMYEVRDDISNLNKLNAEANKLNKSGNFKTYDTALDKLTLQKNGKPNPALLNKYVKPRNSLMPIPGKQSTQPIQLRSSSKQSLPADKSLSRLEPSERMEDELSYARMSTQKSRGGEDRPLEIIMDGSPKSNSGAPVKYSPFVPDFKPRREVMINKYTQTDPYTLDEFINTLEDSRRRLVNMVLNMKVEPELMSSVEMILGKLAAVESTRKRNINFVSKLLENDKIGLLQDATNEGENIEEELVIYIKKLQKKDQPSNKIDLANQILETKRMNKDDSMAHSHFRKKGRGTLLPGQLGDGFNPSSKNTLKFEEKKMDNLVNEVNKGMTNLLHPTPKLEELQTQYMDKYKSSPSKTIKHDRSPKSMTSYDWNAKSQERKSKIAREKSQKSSKLDLIEMKYANDDEMIIKLYEYVSHSKGYTPRYHKYPFKSVNRISQDLKAKGGPSHLDDLMPDLADLAMMPQATELMTITNFDYFKKRFVEILQVHKACGGSMCPHLVRFYERIGFDPSLANDRTQDISLPKTVIDRIVLGDIDGMIEKP